jgi:hypothetical protein
LPLPPKHAQAQPGEPAQLRITLAEGSHNWSYLGTDALHVPSDRPTMALPGLSLGTPSAQLRRAARHAAGHALGFAHQPLPRELAARVDPGKAYVWFRWGLRGWRDPGWSHAGGRFPALCWVANGSLIVLAPRLAGSSC